MNVENVSSEKNKEKAKKMLLESLKQKTSYLLNKPVLEDMDLYYYIKDFFKKYLSFEKELSFGEIMEEIDKTYIPKAQKEEIINYINKIKSIEYQNIETDEKKIKESVKEFYDLAKNLPKAETKKKSFFKKLLDKLGFKKRVKHKKESLRKEEKAEQKTQQEKNEKEQIQEKVEQKTQQEQIPQYREEPEQKTQQEQIPQYREEPEQEELPEFKEEQETRNNKRKKIHEVLKNMNLNNDFTEDIDLNSKQQNKEWAEDVVSEQKPKKQKAQEETKKEDVYELIMKSKTLKNEKDLIEIYKKINESYEKQNMEEKSKIYPELLEIYDKIIQLKKK